MEAMVAGRYIVDRELGRGGVGAVHLAYDVQLERWIAIKRIHADSHEALTRSQAAIAEAKRLASIQHPNIVTVFDFVSEGDDVFVIMEFLPGHTLDELPGPLSVPDFLNLARQALEGLDAAHAHGMIHRDIKPGNIMLTGLASGGFQVKLLDFGLAKVIDTPAMQTIDHSGSLLGSIHTMAPEQFEQLPLDQRTDLYSLGCVLYRALTLSEAFSGDTVAAVMNSHLQHRFEPLSVRRPDVPPAVSAWLEKMFARDPSERPASAREALAELHRAAAGGTVAGGVRRIDAKPARPTTTSARVSGSKHGTGSGWPIFSVGALLAAGVFVYIALHDTPRPVMSSSVPAKSNAVPDSSIPATNRLELMNHLDREVVISGVVSRIGESKSGTVRYLNFEGTTRNDVALVFFLRGSKQDFSPERLGSYVGKRVRVKGTLREFRGNPQLEIETLDQIEVFQPPQA